MALEDILKALDDKAETEMEVMKQEALLQAEDIRSKAGKEAGRARRARLKKVEDNIRSEATSYIYAASLKAKNQLISAQEEVVDEAFELAGERLSAIRSTDRYPGILAQLIEQCIEYIDGEIILQVRADDRALVENVIADKQVPFRILDEPLESFGGVVARSTDGAIVVDNTFEQRMERAKERLRLEIARVLFGTS